MAEIFDWDESPGAVCREIRARPATMKIILKTKDEAFHLQPWIDHHARIAGPENLIIFDNHSTNEPVNRALKAIAGDAVVARFSGFHNRVHHNRPNLKTGFGSFYGAISGSADYFCLVDTDERIEWADRSGALAPLDEIPGRLSAAELGETGLVTSLWMNLVLGHSARYRLFSPKHDWPAGLPGGKTLFSAKAALPPFIGHNFQLKLPNPAAVTCANIMVLHLKHASVEDRMMANLRKLQHWGTIDASLPLEDAPV